MYKVFDEGKDRLIFANNSHIPSYWGNDTDLTDQYDDKSLAYIINLTMIIVIFQSQPDNIDIAEF